MNAQLVVLAQRGDREAFAQLATAVAGRLDALARLITRDRELAEDAVQEGLLKAWRDLPALREPERFEAWVRQLIVRACIDQLRRARRRSIEVELADLHHPRVADTSASLADRDALARGFRKLDPADRALVVMHYYLGLPLADAAAALRIPTGTAKSRLHRARAALRAALEADARAAGRLAEGRP